VSGIGRKKAERLVLELHDRFRDVALPAGDEAPSALPVAEEALRGLEALGYSGTEAAAAVRAVLDPGDPADTPTIIRRALGHLTGVRGGTA
jgi:Holliday junction DNA helicase RuvA